jgi:hypothetical protein
LRRRRSNLPLGVVIVLLASTAGCSTPAPPQQQGTTASSPPPTVRYEGPPIPFDDEGACPFEGCIYREWTANAPVRVLTERRQDAPVAFELAKGARVTAVTGVVSTVVPGIVELMDPVEVQTGQGAIPMRAGEVFYLLTYQGEGFGKAWIKDRVYTDVDLSRFKPKRNPTAIWWVQVRDRRGRVGWTSHPDLFDGKDLHA